MNLYINIKLYVISRNYVDLVDLTDVTVDDDIDVSEESYDLPPKPSSTPTNRWGLIKYSSTHAIIYLVRICVLLEQQGYALIRSHQFVYMYVNKKQAVQCLITIWKSAECNLLLVIWVLYASSVVCYGKWAVQTERFMHFQIRRIAEAAGPKNIFIWALTAHHTLYSGASCSAHKLQWYWLCASASYLGSCMTLCETTQVRIKVRVVQHASNCSAATVWSMHLHYSEAPCAQGMCYLEF